MFFTASQTCFSIYVAAEGAKVGEAKVSVCRAVTREVLPQGQGQRKQEPQVPAVPETFLFDGKFLKINAQDQ